MVTYSHAYLVDGQLEGHSFSHTTGHTSATAATTTQPTQGAGGLLNREPLIGRLLFEDRQTSRTEPEQCNLLADRSSVTILIPEQTCPGPRRKRRVREMGTEEKADRATDEIVDLVEQEVQYPASRLTGTRLYPSRHISAHQIATDTAERLEHAGKE